MPRPRTFTIEDVKNIFLGLEIDDSVITNEMTTNTLIKITCKINANHSYKLSLQQIKSGKDPHICPHCIKDKYISSLGLQENEVKIYCDRNNLDYSPKQLSYKKWANDFITFTCKTCKEFSFTIKSINNWCKQTGNNGINRTLSCPICNKNRLGLLTPEDFQTKIDSIKYQSIPQNQETIENKPLIDPLKDFNLPEELAKKIINQKKWTLIKYINTKQKAAYSCNDCGYVKEIYPHNLFVGRNFGCDYCRNDKTKNGTTEKVKILMKNSNILPVVDSTQNVFIDSTTPIKFKCNSCGMEFERIWQHINAYEKIPCPTCYASTKRASQNELCDWIKSVYSDEVKPDDRSHGFEIDIYLPNKQLGIEYCGLIWHSTKFKEDPEVHKKKLEKCLKKGIRLITIFEDEWVDNQEICKSRILNALGITSTKYYAKDLEVKKIENNIALEFCTNNHIQGKGQSHSAYGLYDKDVLLSVMTFSKPSVSKNASGYDWELNRFCSLLGSIVTGGASRLLAQFKRDNPNIKLTTFCDLRWGTGNVYEKMGFTLVGTTNPNYYYFGKLTEWKRKHRFNFTKQKLLELVPNSTVEMTERELAHQVNLYRIYDCGHLKFEMKT